MPPPPAISTPLPLITSPQTLLSPQASLTGTHPITLHANAVIQVRARLIATHGPVTIREGCIISERASVGILTPDTTYGGGGGGGGGRTSTAVEGGQHPLDGKGGIEGGERRGVCLDKGVVVETGAVVEAAFVGEGSVIEVGATVGRGCVIGKHCKIAPLSNVPAYTTLPDYTVVYGHNERRLQKPGLEPLKAEGREKQIELLRALTAAAMRTGRY